MAFYEQFWPVHTYPSPTPKLTMTCYQLLGELGWLEVYGKGGRVVAQILILIPAARITIVNSANILSF